MSSIGMVVKIGGSLYDLPDLGSRLRRWLMTLPTLNVLFVPGGGVTADAIRSLDRVHHLGEERSHWLALQALSLNAHFLTALLPGSAVIKDVVGDHGQGEGWRILDAFRFALADEHRPGHLPHQWKVTSGSIAARAAILAGARELVLLKSVSPPPAIDWTEAARHGYVDPCFAEVAGGCLSVQIVNFRDWQLAH